MGELQVYATTSSFWGSETQTPSPSVKKMQYSFCPFHLTHNRSLPLLCTLGKSRLFSVTYSVSCGGGQLGSCQLHDPWEGPVGFPTEGKVYSTLLCYGRDCMSQKPMWSSSNPQKFRAWHSKKWSSNITVELNNAVLMEPHRTRVLFS